MHLQCTHHLSPMLSQYNKNNMTMVEIYRLISIWIINRCLDAPTLSVALNSAMALQNTVPGITYGVLLRWLSNVIAPYARNDYFNATFADLLAVMFSVEREVQYEL